MVGAPIFKEFIISVTKHSPWASKPDSLASAIFRYNSSLLGFDSALNIFAACCEFSHLLVWKIDRISRNLLDFCSMYDELKKYNCIFVSKNEQFDTSTAMGEAMLKIILVFAELERKLTGERVTSVMLDRASKGLWTGAPIPPGYKWDETIKFPIIDDEEKNTVDIIFKTYSKTESSSAVTKLLNTNGIKTKRDGRWTTKTICDVIRNPFYKGTYRYNYRIPGHGKVKNQDEWIIIPNNHAGIISEELWEECNKIMDINANKNSARFRRTSKIHIFAGLLECGECNNRSDKTSLDGFTPGLYTCSGRYNHLGCSQKTISDTIIGNFTLNFISNIIKSYKEKGSSISLDDLERKLLSGTCFKDIVGISEIEDLYNSIFYSQSNTFKPYKEGKTESNIIDIDSNKFEAE
ncbi:DNA invertase Pin-like site-specific DNA recombinase [Clostridium saccharoperbutylacetonicum]|uniref:DNA invertase Pin-like site-specific recombinase n=1 Tax=Clostridium saccharoperbutylacetonicum N1-4(HMT) TaxID=931276 RepID=M1N0E1_9CLOT|nr:recombinase family protein [Clostridium saccharoperbutylacetonicum]AGF57042.1 DNA invertase Pin-like site-specific recombinase [Clostridium saccharoperbutylacetonicum N1-4(HMT)]NRT62199.1 DNA invertase Pin-like site-specific DNA recombinase [Clostridium saccharoperbutylacetonicum]NSB25530.1 DNA invertase Pin-like site-specific DNA recombinase [Clostridium saccharoperbutylacetonicum]NSB44900.1 DNA invertase Pin-like site-specific DNA recombinase [Clostridium saccharoperbutylacetonicum]